MSNIGNKNRAIPTPQNTPNSGPSALKVIEERRKKEAAAAQAAARPRPTERGVPPPTSTTAGRRGPAETTISYGVLAAMYNIDKRIEENLKIVEERNNEELAELRALLAGKMPPHPDDKQLDMALEDILPGLLSENVRHTLSLAGKSSTVTVPCFWLNALVAHESGTETPISAQDKELLTHLTSIASKVDNKETGSFSVTFSFDKNPILKNAQVTISFIMDKKQSLGGIKVFPPLEWESGKKYIKDHNYRQKHFMEYFSPPPIPARDAKDFDLIKESLLQNHSVFNSICEGLLRRPFKYYQAALSSTATASYTPSPNGKSGPEEESLKRYYTNDRHAQSSSDDEPLYNDKGNSGRYPPQSYKKDDYLANYNNTNSRNVATTTAPAATTAASTAPATAPSTSASRSNLAYPPARDDRSVKSHAPSAAAAPTASSQSQQHHHHHAHRQQPEPEEYSDDEDNYEDEEDAYYQEDEDEEDNINSSNPKESEQNRARGRASAAFSSEDDNSDYSDYDQDYEEDYDPQPSRQGAVEEDDYDQDNEMPDYPPAPSSHRSAAASSRGGMREPPRYASPVTQSSSSKSMPIRNAEPQQQRATAALPPRRPSESSSSYGRMPPTESRPALPSAGVPGRRGPVNGGMAEQLPQRTSSQSSAGRVSSVKTNTASPVEQRKTIPAPMRGAPMPSAVPGGSRVSSRSRDTQ